MDEINTNEEKQDDTKQKEYQKQLEEEFLSKSKKSMIYTPERPQEDLNGPLLP